MWPFKYNNLIQHTVSEKIMYNFLDTLTVSCILCTVKVKNLLNMNNSQVTKAFNSLVGTSETIRMLNFNKTHNNNKKFVQWLAGLIDGDGSFLLSKKGYASLEITMDIRDEHALQIVKNAYGGSIKLRSGAKALRYRLHHKSGLLKLINDVNGHIRNTNRLFQFNKLLKKYEITLIIPEKLTFDNGWVSGFFDSDGTITINSTITQLSISVSQKTSELLVPLIDIFGGNVYIDRGSSQSFKWDITRREEILKLTEYFKIYPCRSAKKNRVHLIPLYYELKDLNAHKALPPTYLEKSWKYFINKWLNYEDLN
uniref:LAGLIDADG endonuclease n=1 Tax=Fomitopsis dickinsii TaxID=3151107 RepID=UPI002A821175|nr:LAGLIDADG endonuclease [Daedalea dickinsii]WNZ34347.1 LAGLIDADG endonuclease [Daedalea dickinsii]